MEVTPPEERVRECHGHLMMDGADFAAARERHRYGVDEGLLRQNLAALAEKGVSYFRDGGDAWGVSRRGREIAGEYGITVATPLYAIHKKGRYGAIVGRGWDSLDEAGRLIGEAREQGADFIKLILSGIITFSRYGELSCPSLTGAEIRTLISLGHQAGCAVMAHVNGAEAVRQAVEAGADSVEHGYFLDGAAVDAMAERGCVWAPTLAAVAGFVGREGFDGDCAGETLRRQQEMLRTAAEKGVLIARGSDSGAFGVPHGRGTEREGELLNECVDERLWQRGSREIEERFRRR